jgi:hypothetical protein
MKILSLSPSRLLIVLAACLLLEAGTALPARAAARIPDGDPPILPAPSQTQPPQREESGAYAWHDGSVQYSYTYDCFTGDLIYGTGTYVGYWADTTNHLPTPGMVYYVHVVALTVGNACAGPWGFFDLGLPPNTSLAISTPNPVICYFNGVQYTADCPQTLPASPYNPGFYTIKSTDPSWAWPMPYNGLLEFLVPVVSSTTLSGATLQAGLWVIDGFFNSWLNPTYGVYVFSPTVPGTFNKSSPASGGFTTTSPTLSWGSSSGATSYEYCYDTVNDTVCSGSWISRGTSTSVSLSGLVNNQTYYWQVRAKNAGGTTYANGGTWWSFTARNQTFADVPISHSLWQYIEAFYNSGITGGCGVSPLIFCPTQNVTRAAMAVFLLRAKHGSSYTPPSVRHFFADLPVAGKEWQEAWVDQFYSEGITGGCGTNPLIYCPENPVTRAAMAVFILRAEHGSSYTPPAASHYFADMPVAGKEWMEPWVDQVYREGITTGCGTGPLIYCPEDAVKRQAMAAFIVRAFDLPLP